MSWILLTITANFFWAITVIGDKYLVVKKLREPVAYIVLMLMLNVLGILVAPFFDYKFPGFEITLVLLAACTMRFLSNVFYIKAIKMEDPSRVNVFWGLIPIFSMALAWLFIEEKLSLMQLLAIFILMLATLTDSIHLGRGIVKFSKAAGIMTFASFLYAIYAILLKYTTLSIAVTDIFITNSALTFLLAVSTVLSFKKIRTAFENEIQSMDKILWLEVIGLAGLSTCAVMLNTWALSLGPTALIYAMESVQTLFVFAMTVIIIRCTHIDLKEPASELNHKNMAIKFLGLLLMIVGITVINLS